MKLSNRLRRKAFHAISTLYLLAILGLPSFVCATALKWSGPYWVFSAALMPIFWVSIFLGCAGILSLPHRSAVVAGKFPRDVGEPRYFHRRLHGLCWTAVYYNKPAYYLCLSIPVLKWMTFRLFGYQGSMNFTTYPDTWLRDLPLLNFEDGVYLSNRATVGTNVVMEDGTLAVDHITLRKNALLGHLAVLGPGVELGPDAKVGIASIIGFRVKVGRGAFVSSHSVLAHSVRIGENAVTGNRTYIDSGVRIPDETILMPGSIVTRPATTRSAAS